MYNIILGISNTYDSFEIPYSLYNLNKHKMIISEFKPNKIFIITK